MEEKQIYLSFEEENYKRNKARLLKCQAELIKLQKTLSQIKAVRSQKKRLMNNLVGLVSKANSTVFKLDGKLPDLGLPKHIKEIQTKSDKKASFGTEKKKTAKESSDFDINNLDKELLEINRRLKVLEK